MKPMLVSLALLYTSYTLGAGFSPASRRALDLNLLRCQKALKLNGKICNQLYNSKKIVSPISQKIRLAKVQNKIQDLEKELMRIILDWDKVDPSYLRNSFQIRQKLYRTRAYEGELRTAGQFWLQMSEDNKRSLKNTQDLYR